MNDESNREITRRRVDPRKSEREAGAFYEAGPRPGPAPQSSTNGHAAAPRFDPWLIVDLVLHRWAWLLVGMLVAGAAFFALGYRVVKPKFTAHATLLRYQPPGDEDFFKAAQLTSETFAGLIRSPDLMRSISDQMPALGMPAIPPEKLVKAIKIEPEPDSDMVKISLASRNPTNSVDLLNLYVNEAVEFTRKLQVAQASRLANDYLKTQVTQMEKDISALEDQFRKMPASSQVTNLLSRIGGNLGSISSNLSSTASSALLGRQTERLQTALGELNDLLQKYTEIHPQVLAKEDEIRSLSNQIAQATASGVVPRAPAVAALTSGMSKPGEGFNPEMDIIRMKLLSLEEGRVGLLRRQREAAMYAADPPGIARVFAPASLKTVENNMRWVKIGIVSVFGSLLGLAGSMLLVGLVELTDRRLRTAADVKRVTKLPVLTTLGDLHSMSPTERSQWAFRTWTMLQGRLSRSNNHGLVCGITSSCPGEGRSTWISLLAEAASLTGFRVLTIATKPSPTQTTTTAEACDKDKPAYAGQNGHSPENGVNGNQGLSASALSAPARVTEQLTGPNSEPVVHIPLPGWVWNLERRQQWREALQHWHEIDNLVILVELPPAGVSEAVLLGSNLPNMIWLADSGKADAAEVRVQLETLRNARCNLVGAVLNRPPGASLKDRFPRWLGLVVTSALLCAGSATAQIRPAPSGPATVPTYAEDALPASGSNVAFSVIGPNQRASWQQRLTLGPGDVLTVGLYGEPQLSRTELAIAPDGRISYLEAQDVVATGLTVDELRAKLDQELAKFRRAPRTIVNPVSFKSKKYYLLGKVMTKGVYTLDRPMTVLEAIARAKGAESGLVDRNVIDLADFQRSFLVRQGKRIPVNFERLFYNGDLSQNIPIEPGDYIYVPGKDVQEVYVVGEVRLPGPVTFTRNLNIIGAIAARGGYTDRSFKTRVLVVRGSATNPERIVVDTHDTLDGRAPAFQLQPKDIIYVNSRPFILVEEAADLAATAFLQSLVTSWVGVDVVKPVQ